MNEKCDMCGIESGRMYALEFKDHLSDCIYRYDICPTCSLKIRKFIGEHAMERGLKTEEEK